MSRQSLFLGIFHEGCFILDCILKVARTAADLGGSPDIRIEDLAEAIHYRSLDREGCAG